MTFFFVGEFGNSVAISALDGPSSKAAATGFQSSPSQVMVTGLERLRAIKLVSKPVSHDWWPEETSGTMQEALQVPNRC